MQPKTARNSILLVLILGVLGACNLPGTPGSASPGATLTSISGTLAAREAGGDDEAEISGDLPTAQAKATQKSLEIQLTRTAAVTVQAQEATAQATQAAPVLAELTRYGIEPQEGELAWTHDPVTLEMDAYRSYDYANDYPQVVARDFAMAADITWDTQYGTSGCGFLFRADGNQEKPSQYMVIATRGGNGHVMFAAMAQGELANFRDFYATGLDQAFDWENGKTNRLVVVGRGPSLMLYTNGTKLGEVDTTRPPPSVKLPSAPIPPIDQADLEAIKVYQDQLEEYQLLVDQVQYQYTQAVKNYGRGNSVFEQGFVAFLAASESGRTVCTFENAWLWLIQ
jgi:hypothetical protein